MQLVHKGSRQPVQIGELLTDFRGDKARLVSVEEPRHEGSTGRVYVTDDDDTAERPYQHGYYPSVFDLEWER